MSFLKDSTLLRHQAYLDGAWIDADSGRVFDVTNPATGDLLVRVADCSVAETRRAIEAADKAMSGWRAKTAAQRGALLRRWNDLMIEHAEDLALLMTLEQGKPLAESRGEVRYGASFIEWFAAEGQRVYGDIIPAHAPNLRVLVQKQPVGVSAAITPWNFPIAMITRKVAPALAAGCTVVVKPSEETPLCALALAELAHRAGFPPGVINIVAGTDAPAIGRELTGNPLVRKFSFTGSTEVGKLLMRQCADTVKKYRWNSAATRHSSSSMMPISMQPSMAPSHPNTEMPDKPVCVPTGFLCKMAFMTLFWKNSRLPCKSKKSAQVPNTGSVSVR